MVILKLIVKYSQKLSLDSYLEWSAYVGFHIAAIQLACIRSSPTGKIKLNGH